MRTVLLGSGLSRIDAESSVLRVLKGPVEALGLGLRPEVEPLRPRLRKGLGDESLGDASAPVFGKNSDKRQMCVNNTVSQDVRNPDDLPVSKWQPK
jgi:hypothetical protein